MSSSLAGAGVAGAVGTALAAVLGSGAGLKSALGVPARKISIKKRKRKKKKRLQKTSCRVILACSLPAATYAVPNFSVSGQVKKTSFLVGFFLPLARGKEAEDCSGSWWAQTDFVVA